MFGLTKFKFDLTTKHVRSHYKSCSVSLQFMFGLVLSKCRIQVICKPRSSDLQDILGSSSGVFILSYYKLRASSFESCLAIFNHVLFCKSLDSRGKFWTFYEYCHGTKYSSFTRIHLSIQYTWLICTQCLYVPNALCLFPCWYTLCCLAT